MKYQFENVALEHLVFVPQILRSKKTIKRTQIVRLQNVSLLILE